MAKKYLDQLTELMNLTKPQRTKIEIKHFFSGAAVYTKGKICITLTPRGLAMKLPEKSRERLLKEKKARRLRYFPKAPIKKEYVVLTKATVNDVKQLRYLVKVSIEYSSKIKKA